MPNLTEVIQVLDPSNSMDPSRRKYCIEAIEMAIARYIRWKRFKKPETQKRFKTLWKALNALSDLEVEWFAEDQSAPNSFTRQRGLEHLSTSGVPNSDWAQELGSAIQNALPRLPKTSGMLLDPERRLVHDLRQVFRSVGVTQKYSRDNSNEDLRRDSHNPDDNNQFENFLFRILELIRKRPKASDLKVPILGTLRRKEWFCEDIPFNNAVVRWAAVENGADETTLERPVKSQKGRPKGK